VPDVYATIADADRSVVDVLAEVLELRAGDAQQQEIRDAYLARIEFPPGAQVLEVGCGPGPVARALAVRPGIGEVVGVDPSPRFLELARERVGEIANLTFVEGDARALPVDDASFDVVVFHTTLCHVPGPEDALGEAFRVVRPGGWLAVFDGDYVTTTCANSDHDPLQTCLDAAVAFLVHDRWIVRRLLQLVREAGFQDVTLRSHGYVEAPSGGYMLALVDRGADTLRDTGRIGAETAEALKAEARRRSDSGEFFGHIAYASAVARRPASQA
jgi:ubiquinone/menaquinone biosynthesis C-methylase UbiE